MPQDNSHELNVLIASVDDLKQSVDKMVGMMEGVFLVMQETCERVDKIAMHLEEGK